MNLKHFLDEQFEASLANAGAVDAPAVVKQASKPEFGHYQANGIMGAAKKAGGNPRELAEQVKAKVDLDSVADLEIAGPGFINISLKPEFVASILESMNTDIRLGVAAAEPTQRILIDYSSPNLAKEMHIGHLRSTAIGDTAVRVLEFLGHSVIRANHVGDWGSQFGRLLAYMDRLEQAGKPLATELKDLEVFYQKANELAEADDAFAKEAREYVVKLQSGDEKCLTLWQQFIEESIRHCQATYDRLDISLSVADVMPESDYNDQLDNIVAALDAAGLIQIDEGAKCVFLPEFVGKDDKPMPAIIQKSDGGYPYMATDLAAARHRSQNLKVDAALYFVDGRQSLHFSQLYAIARAAGFIQPEKTFKHIPFGAILGKDGRPFKTRDGGAVKLADVIDEAESRALTLVSDKNSELTDSDRAEIAHIVAIGAIKYAELSKNRTTDYIFDWDTMLAFEGNTAPYLQYAYTRVRSIFRKSGINDEIIDGEFSLQEPAELRLAVKLLQYTEAVEALTEDYQANVLCNYLYELAGIYMSFYEACPVLKSEEPTRTSRLMLCALTARVLKHGLSLLGISTVEQM